MRLSDPFKKEPKSLARLPRIVRVYIANCMIGFSLSAIFTGLILWFNVANIGYLVGAVEGGWLAVIMLFVFNGIVFSGVQTGIVIMTIGDDDDDDDQRGKRHRPQRALIPIRVRSR